MREGIGLHAFLYPTSLITAIDGLYRNTCWSSGIDTTYLCFRNCHFHLDC